MRNESNIPIICILAAFSLLGAGAVSRAASVTWTGGASESSIAWTDPSNWSTFTSPGGADIVNFLDQGSADTPGVVNNVVSVDTTITNLTYKARVSYIAMVTNYHTTRIDPGVTLRINRGTLGSSLIYVGEISDPLTLDLQYYYTITGPGGSIEAGNLAEPLSTQGLQVTATQRSHPNHIGSLDLSGLDSFSLAGGYFWVGINGGEGTVATDRPAGRVFLAKTNHIVMVGDYYDGLNLGSFRVGESRANTSLKSSILGLGQENTINTPWLKIGGARLGTGPDQGGFMHFQAGLDKPSLKLRGSDGVSRLGTMRIADNSWSASGSIGTRGVVDLSGGKVDAYVNELYVGRGPGGNNATSPAATAFATGTLTWDDGTFDVLTFLVGYQYGNNPSTNIGVVNVVSPKAKLIADRLVLGRDAGAFSGGGTGILNIDGGTVEITTYLSESPGVGGNATSIVILTNNGVLNLQPEGDLTPAVATIGTLDFSSGIVTNGTLALTNINVMSPATEFVAFPGTMLNPGISGGVGVMTINGDLALKGGGIITDVMDAFSYDKIAVAGTLNISEPSFVTINLLSPVAAGTYPLLAYGTLSGTVANLHPAGTIADSRYTVSFANTTPSVSMTIDGNVSSLTWTGGKNANAWDLKNTANWNGGTEQFYNLDLVEFNDSGSDTPAIKLEGALSPGAVAFNANSKSYTLAGSGKISGLAGLTLNGASTVTLLTTNDYKGTTDINNGSLVVGDGAAANGGLGTGSVNNYGELTFNSIHLQSVASIITGGGRITKRGPGVTRLSGANTFIGPITVEAGTLRAGNANALGDVGSIATFNNGATLDLGGFTIAKPIMIAGAGVDNAGAIINTGAAQAALRDVQLDGPTTFGGAGSWSIASASATSSDPGLTAYGHKITKIDAGQVTIVSLRSTPWNLDLGEVDVREGALNLQGNISLGSAIAQPITVRSNATLVLVNYGGVTLNKAFVFEDGACMHGRGTNSAVDGSISITGNVFFDTLAGANLVINCPINGSGSLIKGVGYHPAGGTSTGTGTLLLNAPVTSTGDLVIQAGLVALANSATIASPNIVLAGGSLSATGRVDGALILANGQSLKGNGTLIGVVSAPAGTTVVPAAAGGPLAVTGDLTLRGTTRMDLQRSGATLNNSRINVTGALDCGGSLVLTSTGDALQAGDTFQLFTAGTILNPFETSAITWPSLASGLFWTNRIAIDGTVAVGSLEPVDPPQIAATVSNGNLTLTWPIEYTTYILQGQTNSVDVGLSDNWAPVAGVVDNQISIPLDPANGGAFYRLIRP